MIAVTISVGNCNLHRAAAMATTLLKVGWEAAAGAAVDRHTMGDVAEAVVIDHGAKAMAPLALAVSPPGSSLPTRPRISVSTPPQYTIPRKIWVPSGVLKAEAVPSTTDNA